MIVVATKLDATTNRTHLEELRAFAAKRGLPFYAVSSASGEGIVALVRGMADALDRIPRPVSAALETGAGETHASPGPGSESARHHTASHGDKS